MTIKITCDTNSYIANHEASVRYLDWLEAEEVPLRPATAMVLVAARKNLERVRRACPDELLDVLGLQKGGDGLTVPSPEATA